MKTPGEEIDRGATERTVINKYSRFCKNSEHRVRTGRRVQVHSVINPLRGVTASNPFTFRPIKEEMSKIRGLLRALKFECDPNCDWLGRVRSEYTRRTPSFCRNIGSYYRHIFCLWNLGECDDTVG